jgi:hypothetical protein
MLGIILFIYAILDYIKNNIGETLQLTSTEANQEEITTQKPIFKVRKEPVNIK